MLDAATLTPGDYRAAPWFAYDEEPATLAAARVAMAIVAMTVAAIALIAIGFRNYRGYSL